MGRVVIITGGAGGIGQALGATMAGNGDTVVLADINLERVKEVAATTGCDFVYMDMGNVASVRAAIADVAAKYGRIDVLVNNAGIFRLEPMLDVTEETYDLLMDINLKGAFFALQAAAAEMLKNETGGVVVNVASAAGRSGRPTQTIYGLSKAGMVHLTKSAAIALAPKIRVCCVCPAAVDTDMSTAQEVADLVIYLASDKAGYITGGSVDISGGLDMH
ncbi:MAG: SDR family NAD(P)-dependent oxidoreductase [Armatimonadaceae bacterium]